MINYKNKTLLITGGTGSFGNAVLTKYLNSDFGEIRIFSRDEKKQHDLRVKYQNDKIKFFIGDVRDYNSIYNALKNVDYVFNAAALKQVPSCEFFPIEATKTNVNGIDNVVRASIENKVKKVICLSTDKAAYPINAMGISKALMEKVAIANAREINPNKTAIAVTRYGNVMASRGSVIPHFIEQIKQNRDLTITEPSMTRFLMSLEEAVDLVEFAFQNVNQGDLFIQKAPATNILTLAESLIEIFDSKNKTKIIGIRHGEKMHETLATSEELIKAIDLGGYYRIPADNRDLNYEKYYNEGNNVSLEDIKPYTSENTIQLNKKQVIEKLLKLDYVKNELK
jgi:UDP-N-acetylglucosamine 4,6-dehydratase/5-epimerase